MLVAHPLGTDSGLVNHVRLADHTINLGFQFVTHAVLIEIRQDVWPHLQFWRRDEENPDPIKLGQQVGERPRCTPPVQLANDGDTQANQRSLSINRVEIQKRLRGMLSAVSIPGVDDWNGGNLGCALRPSRLGMAYDDYVGII